MQNYVFVFSPVFYMCRIEILVRKELYDQAKC